MEYISTRGQAPARDFEGVLLAGLAEDGGLFVPRHWPELSPAEWRAMRGLSYAELAARIIGLFAGPGLPLDQLCKQAYAGFGHPAIVPLIQLDQRCFALELFHGPTLAFKDMALQLLGPLFDNVLTKRGERVTIVGATSGDTGSAAIEACRDRAAVDIVILHPEGRTSEVQRRQMTSVLAANVSNIAIKGDFDACQDLVKAMFNDAPFRQEMRLSAVNSINWARIAAQIPYYVAAALAHGAPDRPVAFSVPTGNFGNVLAAWAAMRMGLPVAKLIVGSNRNDILARFLTANDMTARPVDAMARRRRKPCAASAPKAACPLRMPPGGKRPSFSPASPWMMLGHSPKSAICIRRQGIWRTLTPRSAPLPRAPWRRKTVQSQ